MEYLVEINYAQRDVIVQKFNFKTKAERFARFVDPMEEAPKWAKIYGCACSAPREVAVIEFDGCFPVKRSVLQTFSHPSNGK